MKCKNIINKGHTFSCRIIFIERHEKVSPFCAHIIHLLYFCILDAIKARQNVRFVTFYQKKFVDSSKEAYYYGEKCSVLADIFTFAHLEYFVKNLLFAPFL